MEEFSGDAIRGPLRPRVGDLWVKCQTDRVGGTRNNRRGHHADNREDRGIEISPEKEGGRHLTRDWDLLRVRKRGKWRRGGGEEERRREEKRLKSK